MPRVLFTEAAQNDFAEAIDWYEDESLEVADRFEQAIDEIVRRIEDNPRQFAPSPFDTRRAVLRRFPYLLIFRERADACYVVAVFHTSRDPSLWQERVSE